MINRLLILMFIFLFSGSLFSQEMRLKIKAGEFIINQEFDVESLERDNYRIIFFDEIPTNSDKQDLKKLGVEFLEYLPKNIFIISLDNPISL